MAAVPAARDFRSVKAWEKAHQLTLDAYRITRAFPREELFVLTSQIRRSASSVPTNIAEGCGRGGAELGRFCRIAIGSASELEYQFLLARDLELLKPSDYERLAEQVVEVKRMLTAYVGKLIADS
ncbi:MAG: four helix bundle protein [Thermomicrobiales bacterium]